MSKFRREFKNVVYNYTDAEVKVRDATSNDPWGPSGAVLAEIAEFTFHIQAYSLVMGMLWKRLNDHGKNWRHVYKALVVLEYLIKSGSERVVQQCKDNLFSIETLKDFQFIDKDGKDQGNLVRDKAKVLVELLKDDQQLAEVRARAATTRNTSTTGFGSNSSRPAARTNNTTGANHPSSVRDSSSPTAVFQPHIDQSRPSARDEEDLQLQLALRMSKEQADEEDKLRKQEEESLKLALEMSKKEQSTEREDEQEETNDTSAPGDVDLLGISDPWSTTNTELPPSYDIVTNPNPWGSSQPVTAATSTTTTTSDGPFVIDPFVPLPSTTIDPFQPTTSSDFGGVSTSTWTSFSPTSTTPPDPFTLLPPASIASSSMDIIQDPPKPDTFDFTSLNAPLQSIDTTQPTQKPTVEESFLGTNATLVNLDTLIAPLPPPTSINPFGISTTPPINRANNNPFDVNKPPAPTLAQLQQGPTFDPLPPPLLPVNDTTKDPFNPFS